MNINRVLNFGFSMEIFIIRRHMRTGSADTANSVTITEPAVTSSTSSNSSASIQEVARTIMERIDREQQARANPINSGYLLDPTVASFPAIRRPISNAELCALRRRQFESAPSSSSIDGVGSNHNIENIQENTVADQASASLPLAEGLNPSFFEGVGFLNLAVESDLNNQDSSSEYLDRINEGYVGTEFSREVNNHLGLNPAFGGLQGNQNRERFIQHIDRNGFLDNGSGRNNRLNNFSRWGPNSESHPRHMSRHEMVISMFFGILNAETFAYLGTIIGLSGVSSIFILFVFRPLWLTVLNSRFWSEVRTIDIREIFNRSYEYVHNVMFISPTVTNETVVSTVSEAVANAREVTRVTVDRYRNISFNRAIDVISNVAYTLTGAYVTYIFRRELRDAFRGVFSDVTTFFGRFFEIGPNPELGVIETVDVGNLVDDLILAFFSMFERHADFLRIFFENPYF